MAGHETGEATELERLIRSDVLSEIETDPSGELAAMSLADLLIVYFNWRERFLTARPRRAHLSAELRASSKYLEYEAAITAIVAKIEAGQDLNPYLSKRVEYAYVPSSNRPPKRQLRKDLDLLAAEWGLHHLHLATYMEADGFIRRSSDLLFASFHPNDAYLVAIFSHGSWTKSELATIAVRNWPRANIFLELHGVTGLAQHVEEADRPRLRNAGVTTALEVDGRVYMPPGQTLAGTSARATRTANAAMHALLVLRNEFSSPSDVLVRKARDAGLSLDVDPKWEACFRDGWYGIREEQTRLFVRVVALGD